MSQNIQQKTVTKTAKKNKNLSHKSKNFFSSFISQTIGEGKELEKYWRIVDKIEALDGAMQKLTDEELRAKTQEFRSQFIGLEGKAIQKKWTFCPVF